MSVRGPYTKPSSKHRRRTYKGPIRRPAWSARALVAIILAILVVTLVIVFAVSR
jgi:hypothetical protein